MHINAIKDVLVRAMNKYFQFRRLFGDYYSFSSNLSNYYDAGGRVLPLLIMKYKHLF